MTAQTYRFTLWLEGVDPLTPERLDALYEAGCGDATFGRQGDASFGDFDRQAANCADAVGSAIGAVEGAVPGLKVVRVERHEPAAVEVLAKG
jgi:hypothetical protein